MGDRLEMFGHWEHQNSRRWEPFDDLDPLDDGAASAGLAHRMGEALHTAALAAAASILSASASMWLVEHVVG